MMVAQEIAGLLGETTTETKVTCENPRGFNSVLKRKIDMSVSVDISWKSLNKHHEELSVETKVKRSARRTILIIILADGMGSSVGGQYSATLTSKILGTMFLEGHP